jgi:transposase-like protein
MVYAFLGSETQETYSTLLTVLRNILPLCYNGIRLVTDYESALMNAIREVFPNSQLVCCWFHYTNINIILL